MSVDVEHSPAPHGPSRDLQHATARVSAGKLATWIFLATEVMFFTGLIGSYIVLRAGSPDRGYSNILPPAVPSTEISQNPLVGLRLSHVSNENAEAAAALVRPFFDRVGHYEPESLLHLLQHGDAIIPGLRAEEVATLRESLGRLGVQVEDVAEKTASWPAPYDTDMNPLSIDLTAINTFVLICSSVTMVLALSAIQRGDRGGMLRFLFATLVLGGVFLGVQVFEYRELMFGHVYSPGVSADGHFRPGSSLFASCFFTMTGFHGAHVACGLIALFCVLVAGLFGKVTRTHHAALENVGLYWHFVDLVWILLFTIVYLI